MKGPEHCLTVPARVLDDGALDPVWHIPSRNTGRGVYGHGELKDLIVRKRRETDMHASVFYTERCEV